MMQNDDTEINLLYEDFTKTEQNPQQGQTVYFDSFPDSAVDDQEQKLLGDEEEKVKSTHSFWTFEYYQQFMNVESKQVGDRIIWSMVPKPGVNYLQSYIRPNPDLYGPFWICITLVFTSAIAGNLSNYLLSTDSYHWKYDFHKVTLATSSIFTYAWLMPLLIWGILLWKGSNGSITLLELICLYGYSLAVFVPVSLFWSIPLKWLQWCLGIVASVLSGSVLVRTIQPAISREAKNVAIALGIFVLFLHAALALSFMVCFYFPSSSGHSIAPPASLNESNVVVSDPNAGSAAAAAAAAASSKENQSKTKRQENGDSMLKLMPKKYSPDDVKKNESNKSIDKIKDNSSIISNNAVNISGVSGTKLSKM